MLLGEAELALAALWLSLLFGAAGAAAVGGGRDGGAVAAAVDGEVASPCGGVCSCGCGVCGGNCGAAHTLMDAPVFEVLAGAAPAAAEIPSLSSEELTGCHTHGL